MSNDVSLERLAIKEEVTEKKETHSYHNQTLKVTIIVVSKNNYCFIKWHKNKL